VMTVLTALVLGLAMSASAADRPAAGGEGGRGGFGGPGGLAGLAGMMGQRDRLAETVMVVAELNLQPDFTLTQDQKVKIKAIRDEFRDAAEKFRKDNEEAFAKLREEMGRLRDGGGRDAWQELARKRQELMDKGPKGEEYAERIKAVLNEEQAKAMEKALAEREERRRETEARMRENMRNMFGGGRGGQGGAQGGGQGGQDGGAPRRGPGGGQRGPGGGGGGVGDI